MNDPMGNRCLSFQHDSGMDLLSVLLLNDKSVLVEGVCLWTGIALGV